MRYDKDEIKESLTPEDITKIAESLGACPPSFNRGAYVFETICHNLPGEGSHKLYYYDNTKLFKCYTGCGEYFDIFELISKAMETQTEEEFPLYRSVIYVADMFGIQGSVDSFEDMSGIKDYMKDLVEIERLRNKASFVSVNADRELEECDGRIMTHMPSLRISHWEKEGINKDTCDRYGIKYYPSDCQIIIPHEDENGRLVGIRSRALCKEEAEFYGKYRPATIAGVMYNHPLGYNLYGLYQNKENIKIIKKVIVFEGEKSVLLYDSIFGAESNISVACCGSSISQKQIKLLAELGVNEVVIAFDRQYREVGDEDCRHHVKNLRSLAEKVGGMMSVSCLFDRERLLDFKSSPIDHGRDTFLKLFQNRIYL